VLAVVFGIIALTQINRANADGGGKGMAVAGIVLGAIGADLADDRVEVVRAA
jgi:hypothetical protein